MKYNLILASGSPRRKELLSKLGLDFKIIVSEAKENYTSTKPDEIVKELSDLKARAVADTLDESGIVIIGADTIVCLDDVILGKPKDRMEAYKMISSISGRSHSVFTGVTVLAIDDKSNVIKDTFAVETKVVVNSMTEEEINSYIDTPEPYDKAGGYGIQGLFSKYIKEISGDYFNVVGLPVSEVYKRVRKYEFV